MRRTVARGAAGALGAGAVLGGVLFGAGPAASDEPPVAVRGHGLAVSREEVAELRTGTSRTFALSDGSFEQELSRTPINFRDQAGRWTPIDSTLERHSDGSLENRANSFEVSIPAAADDPVEVAAGGRTLAFELVGGRSQARSVAEDAEATFADALPGVDAVYEAQSASLKETLFLDDASAAEDLRFDVDAPGLSARVAESGAVEFRDSAGRFRFGFAAPWMSDAAGELSRAVHYELVQGSDGPRVSIQVDARWLADPARRFPVAVDPTVYYDAYGVCQLIDGTGANTTDCGAGPAWVGRFGGRKHRAAIAFPTPELPYGAVVLGAQTTFWFEQQSEEECSTLDLYGLTRELEEGATWNKADPRTSWTTPGGDLKPVRETRRELQPEWTGYWSALAMHRLVQGWVDETEPNKGVLVKAADESVNHIDILSDIHTTVRYRQRLGLDETAYTYDQRELSDGSVVSVNLGNGNLVVTADDFGLDGFDDQLTVDRSYNSMDDVTEQGVFGVGWRGDLGTVSLDRNWVDGSYAFNGATGLDGLFVKRADGTFQPPEGWNATLTEHPTTNAVTVVFDDTGEQWDFEWASGDRWRLARRAYPSEAGAQATYDARTGTLASLRDAAGNLATFAWDGPVMDTVRDQGGIDRHYDYDSNGRLTRYTNASGGITTYAYTGGRLTAISLPDRSGMTFTYWPEGELRTLTPIGTDSTPGPTTTYDGATTYTTIDTPGQKRAVRHFDRTLLNTQAGIGPTPPALRLSGTLVDAQGTTLALGAFALTYEASEPSGINRLEIAVNGSDGEEIEPECVGACGTPLGGTWTLDTDDYTAGLYVIRVRATDGEGDTRETAFKVRVPRDPYESDGEMPGDDVLDPILGTPTTTGPCEAAFGIGSPLCSTEGTDPESEGPSTLSLVDPSRHPVVFGIAQDFWETDWIESPYTAELGVRQYRRIIPFNLMATTDGKPFTVDARSESWNDARRRLVFSDRVDQFRDQYLTIYSGSRERARGEMMVSLAAGYCEPAFPLGCRRDSRGDSLPNWDLPSQGRYRLMLRNFLSTFGNINVVSAWNEPNHPDQPVHTPGRNETGLRALRGGAPRAAYYTLWAAKECASRVDAKGGGRCSVMAAELFQDQYFKGAKFISYLADYRRALRTVFGRESRPLPKIWAFHPYSDVKYDRRPVRETTGADRFAQGLPPNRHVWYTEVGSRVDSGGNGGQRRNRLPSQAEEVRHLLTRVIHRRSSIKRMYYYSLCAPPVLGTFDIPDFDSGLIGGRLDRFPYGRCGDRPEHADYEAVRPAYRIALEYMR